MRADDLSLEMPLVPDFHFQTVRPETTPVEGVCRMLRDDIVTGRVNLNRQIYLKGERESYSPRGSCIWPVDGARIQKSPHGRIPCMAPTCQRRWIGHLLAMPAVPAASLMTSRGPKAWTPFCIREVHVSLRHDHLHAALTAQSAVSDSRCCGPGHRRP